MLYNADLEEMTQVGKLQNEIKRMKNIRNFIHESLTNISYRLTDMPRGGNGSTAEDKYAEIDSVDRQLAERISEYSTRIEAVQKKLDAIPDLTIRGVLACKYIDGKSGRWIQGELNVPRRRYNEIIEKAENSPNLKIFWQMC